MNKVFAIRVVVNNYETYEDHRYWTYIYTVFSTKEKAEEFLVVADNIKNIVLEDGNAIYTLEKGAPIQFKKLINNTYDVWSMNEVYSDDGNEIIGYRKCDEPEIWNILNFEFIIDEWEVE